MTQSVSHQHFSLERMTIPPLLFLAFVCLHYGQLFICFQSLQGCVSNSFFFFFFLAYFCYLTHWSLSCIFIILASCVLQVEMSFSFSHTFFSGSAETDDYAEIIDEEDTYTMPSSK